jgi:hypothetical protein
MDQTTVVDVRIGSDNFHILRDAKTGATNYFLNGRRVTVTDYLARMQHYRDIEVHRLFGRVHRKPATGIVSAGVAGISMHGA